MIDEMKDLGGRSRHSGTVIKKKTSSGCLVIKNNNTNKRDYYENREFETTGSRGIDVFEFDEYDDDNKRMRRDGNDGRYRWNAYRDSGERMEVSNGGLRPPRFEIEDDECDLPLSVLRNKHRLSSGKSIRLQGKNGVLKVMVNKNKQIGVSQSSYGRKGADNLKEREKMLRRDDANKRKAEMKSSFDSDYEHRRKQLVSKSKEKSHSRGESVKNEGIFVKKGSDTKGKESKVKPGRRTEKQILREKIKDLLVDGGWTIDYRPRRNRDYLDAVYTSPSGTAYWSIIKAYDIFQKEEGHYEDGDGNFTPLRGEILGKLSRQPPKNYEIDMKNKRKIEEDDKEERLNSYGRKSMKIGRCSLLVRDYGKAENRDGFVPYSGRRTLLSWLIDSGVVHSREHVEYVNRRKTQILQKGWITKDGIHCDCCSKIVSVLKFEAHAGSKLRDPFPSIFLESGKSLMQCQIDAWNKLGELERKGFYTVDADGDDPNDDTCGLCGDGGDLICCDGCPSTFHQTCLDLPMLPQGDWFCPNCSCKYCEIACTDSTKASLLMCYLCQKKYHESCRPETDVKQIESDYPDLSFCGHTCHELYSRLQKLIWVKHKLDSGFSWSLIHRSELSTDASSVPLSQRVGRNSMLAVAMSVMDECFMPFTDRRSGINLIRNVVFNCGSNLNRLNYSGFFTAILERGNEVICAASIRIHGTRIAEMPFIGTRHIYRRQGMCRRLLSAIEMALSSLQVEKLMIPAIPEHMDTWTDVFGFHRLEESDKQELRRVNMLVFPRTDLLQKPLVKVKTDSGSREPVDDASTTPCEPTLSGSVDAHSDLDPSGLPSSNSCEPVLQLQLTTALEDTDVKNVISLAPNDADAHCESFSIDAHSDLEPNADESTVKVANGLPSSNTCEPVLQLHSTTDLEDTDVKNVISLAPNDGNAHCESLSIDAHSYLEPNADESIVKVDNGLPSSNSCESVFELHSNTNLEDTDVKNVISLAPNDGDAHCESLFIDAHPDLVPNADESTVKVANGLPSSNSCEPVLQLHSNTNLEDADLKNVISLASNDGDAHCESLSLEADIATTVEESSAQKDLSAKP